MQTEIFETEVKAPVKMNAQDPDFDFSPFHFYTDGGHGWLKCPKEIARSLGFEKQITGYSYQDSANYYLEEDCDITPLFKALNINYEEGESVFRKQGRERFWRCIEQTDTSMKAGTIFVRKLRHVKG